MCTKKESYLLYLGLITFGGIVFESMTVYTRTS